MRHRACVEYSATIGVALRRALLRYRVSKRHKTLHEVKGAPPSRYAPPKAILCGGLGTIPARGSEAVNRIEYGKKGGTLWLDSVVNIGAYWLGQKTVTAVTPSKDGSDTRWTWQLSEHFPPGKSIRVTFDGGTLKQNGNTLTWDEHGYDEVALDPGSLVWSP